MSKRDPDLAFRQMLEYCQEVVEITRGKSRADLDNDRVLNLALARLLEIIGEAANRIPDDIQSRYPELPWLQMISARNRLIMGTTTLTLIFCGQL